MTFPRRETSVKQKNPRKALEKESWLEGAKPLQMTGVTHFQLFFNMPRSPKNESKGKLKWYENQQDPLLEHPRASFGQLWGFFLALLFKLCLNAKMVAKIMSKWRV